MKTVRVKRNKRQEMNICSVHRFLRKNFREEFVYVDCPNNWTKGYKRIFNQEGQTFRFGANQRLNKP